MQADPGIVIVGAGLAGLRAALALRDGGYDGALTLLGEERHAPYDRPPLSKAVLLKQQGLAQCTLAAAGELEARAIEFRASAPVLAIDRARCRVRLSDGEELPYERLLLATGAEPRRLRVPGAERAGVHYLRTADDAERLAQQLQPGRRIVLIGGGFIGLEVAASAIAAGCDVTVIEAADRLLARLVPIEIAARIEERHRAAGVRFRFGVTIEALGGVDEGVSHVWLRDGEAIGCDLVVVGIGAVPRTALAEEAGLEVDDGIVVDACLATRDPRIFAAGDVCRFADPLLGRSTRLECWKNAEEQAATAARNLRGERVPHAAVPWFWSDQYELSVQIAGLPASNHREVRRCGETGDLLIFHLDEAGALRAVSGVGSASIGRDVRIGQMLIERRARIDPHLLANPGSPLKPLLKTVPALEGQASA
jgi:3-phenylpropionate/trans-cinnamate dioxygenase ferredoxin reductase subunit